MSGRDARLETLSATQIENVDAVCERFERAWQEGRRPRIEDFLDAESEAARPVLLQELMAAELEWRRSLGECPDRQEYLERLGDYAWLVEAAFESAGSAVHRQKPAPAAGRRFRILRPHAQGGLGVISVADDEELHREVALKEIQPRFASRPEYRARFLREAEINGGLEHPGIVPVYSLGQHPDGRPFYAMRLIRGTSLKEAIAEFHRDGRHRPQPGPTVTGAAAAA